MDKISIIIPAYNEEKLIGETLESLKDLTEIKEIIVVNDGSSDRTGEIARQYKVKVVDLPQNKGKGEAVQEGISQATSEIIALIDADLGNTAREVKKLITPVITNEADMTIARFKGRAAGGGFGIIRKLSSFLIKLATNQDISSPLSGQRVLKKEIVDNIGRLAGGFGLEFAL
ncbi:MAG: glycosyl transferase, partial [Firmicutes bacterium HGW-Firmicutes-13]